MSVNRLYLARRQRGGNAPRFSFLPLRFFSCPLRYFFGRKKKLLLGGKNVKICDFGQIKPSDFGEDLFFWRSPAFGRKIYDFGQKNSAKTFAPPISRSWRRPWITRFVIVLYPGTKLELICLLEKVATAINFEAQIK